MRWSELPTKNGKPLKNKQIIPYLTWVIDKMSYTSCPSSIYNTLIIYPEHICPSTLHAWVLWLLCKRHRSTKIVVMCLLSVLSQPSWSLGARSDQLDHAYIIWTVIFIWQLYALESYLVLQRLNHYCQQIKLYLGLTSKIGSSEK
jgi:hypothetical protein